MEVFTWEIGQYTSQIDQEKLHILTIAVKHTIHACIYKLN